MYGHLVFRGPQAIAIGYQMEGLTEAEVETLALDAGRAWTA